MAIVSGGVLFYDIRTCFRGTVGDVGIDAGDSVYIATDGLLYPVNADNFTVVHGWALTDGDEDDVITVFTTGRIEVETAQTVGARVNTGDTEVLTGTGSPPSTTFTGGLNCGFAYAEYAIFVNIPSPPDADGPAPP